MKTSRYHFPARILLATALLQLAAPLRSAEPPKPFGALPESRHVGRWDCEFYGFLHFTVNTFTDREWGYGDEKPEVFNPTDFDADQIVSACVAGGMKGLILTAKHHDGFCLWPSAYTEHSVKHSPWKGGKGDVVREVSEACRRHGLKFGVYLSPWDRNSAAYGKPEYLTYYRNQLRELLENYGEIFEVWFDGANGGDGYYGGAREKRSIDNRTYYDWPATWQLVRALQPNAWMFSDGGPDCRWIGNERGIAGDPCWATLKRDDFAPGIADSGRLNRGDRDGTHWIPGECDVSIRPGWFYHAKEDSQVKTPRQLADLYFKSVGRGATFLLNLPPDRRGRLHERDVASLKGFGDWQRATFGKNLASGARVTADNVRGGDPTYAASNVLDGELSTYWCTDDAARGGALEIDLGKPVTFNVVSLREYIPLGQRIEGWALDRNEGGRWVEFAQGAAIGLRRLWRGESVTTDKVRLRLAKAPACVALSEFGLYAAPDASK